MASEWPLPLFAMPRDNIASDVASVTCATADADYPAANLVDLKPAKPFKSTTTGAVIVFTFGSARALKAIVAVNHNLAGITATLTNNNGLTPVSLVFPANGGDNNCRNAWARFDSQAAGVRSATVWTLTIAGAAANVAIGEILLLTDIRDFDLVWGLKVKPRHKQSRPGQTFGGTHLKYDKRILIREMSGQVNLKEDEAILRQLEAESKGGYRFFTFIEDEAENDPILMELDLDTFEYANTNPGIAEMPIRATETSSGPPLFV